MNLHAPVAVPAKDARTLYDIEVDISDVFNLLDHVDKYVNRLEIYEDEARQERENLMSILRGTTALAARALASLEAYRKAHPQA